MSRRLPSFGLELTITCRRWILICAAAALLTTPACRGPRPEIAKEPETLSRTEFTDRIESFFEHEPLTPGKPSRFLIHLTDLADGSPVEKAEVTLTVRPSGAGGMEAVTKARVGKVTGIYVAEVVAPSRGSYTINFHIKNPKLDERMALTGFTSQ